MKSSYEEIYDPYKPLVPYVPGLVLNVSPHTPPEPFGWPYLSVPPPPREETDQEILERICNSEYCVRYGPVDTAQKAEDQGRQRRLKIVRQIRCEQLRTAMIVKCRWDDDDDDDDDNKDGKKNEPMVAKIFDPMYAAYKGYNVMGDVNDSVLCADEEYSREAAAYEQLRASGHDGAVAPRYHGSWTFQLPIVAGWEGGGGGETVQRNVRMVLLEYIRGVPMEDLTWDCQGDPLLPAPDRLRLLARAMELETRCFSYGVLHRDFAARNVMISGLKKDGVEGARVRLIDFNWALAAFRPRTQRWFCPPFFFPPQSGQRHDSPVDRYWEFMRVEGGHAQFDSWVPDEMGEEDEEDRQHKAWHEWLRAQWPDDDEHGEFKPAKGRPSRHGGRPQRCHKAYLREWECYLHGFSISGGPVDCRQFQ